MAEGATTGTVRSEPDTLRYTIDEGRLAIGRRDDEIIRLLGLRDPRASASLRLAATRTYNRVEGWPIEFGPRLTSARSTLKRSEARMPRPSTMFGR